MPTPISEFGVKPAIEVAYVFKENKLDSFFDFI